MAKIRHLEIQNFRSIKSFTWRPTPGLNCLIGPGDSGKSTIIDAIDLALGPRQTKLFSDTDFFMLDTDNPIQIDVTVGDLADPLKNFEKYDLFLRGYDLANKAIEDEPGSDLETVLTVRLKVGADLDPVWSLYSARAEATGKGRNLTWGDRVLLAGTRIGSVADYHLSWRKGAVLNRLGEERPNTTSAIADAKRAARKAFSESAQPDLKDVLDTVEKTADTLGVPVGDELQALLNAHSVSLSGGTISVHDKTGLPLSSLGLGSSRLLVAGLLDKAKDGSDLILVDEIEHGLEPHRVIRFLDAIGAKDSTQKKQSFVSSHSPIVLRELEAEQLFRLSRTPGGEVGLHSAVVDEGSRGALRTFPEAFLAKAVILCEGASEVGLLRGFDLHRVNRGETSIWAKGVSLIDVRGVKNLYRSAPTLQGLGYGVASFRDDDEAPDTTAEALFEKENGTVFKWAPGEKIETAIVKGCDEALIPKILALAEEFVGGSVVDDHIKSASKNACCRSDIETDCSIGSLTDQHREWIVTACSGKNKPWFKSVTAMQRLSAEILAPPQDQMSIEFNAVIDALFEWADGC